MKPRALAGSKIWRTSKRVEPRGAGVFFIDRLVGTALRASANQSEAAFSKHNNTYTESVYTRSVHLPGTCEALACLQ